MPTARIFLTTLQAITTSLAFILKDFRWAQEGYANLWGVNREPSMVGTVTSPANAAHPKPTLHVECCTESLLPTVGQNLIMVFFQQDLF